jgi:hypothetical protein
MGSAMIFYKEQFIYADLLGIWVQLYALLSAVRLHFIS